MKVTVELSAESLAALADAIATRLKKEPALPDPSAAERFVTRAEATQMGLERRALLRAEHTGRLQAFKPGRVIVYRRRDVEALIEASVKVRSVGPERRGSDRLNADRFDKALQNAEGRAASALTNGR
ncbi:MAG: hypothetical protein ABSC94_32060 [Polyangiaceae bacterium]|jgi:hypothetical protein